jgi:hypothetical protein
MKWCRELFVLTPFWLTFIHVILQLLDLATTICVVQYVGVQAEINPLVCWIISYGIEWFIYAKLIMCGIMTLIIPWSLKRSPNYQWVWRWLAILYFAVVLNNFANIPIIPSCY